MYNIYFPDGIDEDILAAFGEKYDPTDDLSQANVIVLTGEAARGISLESKLIFAVADLSGGASGLDDEECANKGIAVFRGTEEPQDIAARVRDYIENGNISGSSNYPDVSLGEFGSDVSRMSIMMKGIDDPILLGAMMESGMDVRAIAGGIKGEYGSALIALREPVTRVPHVEGVLKVRVLQDI